MTATRRSHHALLLTGALLALVSARLPAQDPARGEPWPFGKAGRFASGRDLWNLGLLGAKAWDAERDLPARTAGGRRSTTVRNDDPKDLGPALLRVIAVMPDGPAAGAGLRAGDVVVGVGRRRFKQGFRQPLAKALARASGGAGKGTVSLLVRRAGAKKPVRVAVQVPVGPRSLQKPTSAAARQVVLDAALVWLANRQLEDGGFKETLSGAGGAVVQASLAGLAWLAGGSDLANGPQRDNVTRALAFVQRTVHAPDPFASRRKPGEPSWDQSNWPLAHAGLLLGELHARTQDPGQRATLQVELQKIVAALSRNQVASGGWAHGTGGPNALGYLELNIVTGLALFALGAAERAGCTVDRKIVLNAMAYIKASSSGGGVGYSDRPGQKGQGNIGRTAATWLGYRLLGMGKRKEAQALGAWVGRRAGDVRGGHASLMQHVLLAGLGAQAAGKSASKKFFTAVGDDLVLARAPDGSLQPRPWHETLSSGSNSDVSFGEVWTTAAWAIVLGAAPTRTRPGLPALLDLKPPRR